jgi:hypothetical protein
LEQQIRILPRRERLMKTAENVTTKSDEEETERVKALCGRQAGRDGWGKDGCENARAISRLVLC